MKKKIVNIDEFRFRPRKGMGPNRATLDAMRAEQEEQERLSWQDADPRLQAWKKKIEQTDDTGQIHLNLGDEGQKFR